MAGQITSANLPFNYDNVANFRIANKATGTNLADKILNTANSMGSAPGEIWVFSEAAVNNINFDVEVKSGITLRFFPGLYKIIPGTRLIMQDYSKIVGSGWNTIIEEPTVPWAQRADEGITGLASYNFITTRGALGKNGVNGSNGAGLDLYGQNRAMPSYGLEVSNLKFQGVKQNPIYTSNATIGFNNCHWGIVKDCWFKGTSGYAMQLGSTSGGSTDAQRMEALTVYTQFGRNLRFTNNLCENLNSQNIGVISAENSFIDHNTFRNPNKEPFIITSAVSNADGTTTINFAEEHNFEAPYAILIGGASGGGWAALNAYYDGATAPTRTSVIVPKNSSTYGTYTANSGKFVPSLYLGAVIDYEANVGGLNERFVNFQCTDNLFDLRDVYRLCSGIGIQAPNNGMLCYGGNVSDNVMWGCENGIGRLNDGIAIPGGAGNIPGSAAKSVKINNNSIDGAGAIGLWLSGNHLTVTNNTLTDCGIAATSPLRAEDLKNSLIQSNKIVNSGGQIDFIQETGTNTGNRWVGNTIGGRDSVNPLTKWVHEVGSTVTRSIYKNNILAGSSDGIGSIIESANSDYNTYTGNLSGLGVSKVGANSKIITDEFLDGSILITNLVVPVTAVSTGGLTNFARAAGASAAASANYTNGADVTAAAYAIDGTRAANYPAIVHSTGAVPYTLDIDFGASRVIKVVNIFFYDGDNKAEPTVNTSLVQFPFKKFNILYLSGTAWVTKSTEANNTKALKQFDWTAAPVTTTKIRFEVTDVSANGGNAFARIEEIEAFG